MASPAKDGRKTMHQVIQEVAKEGEDPRWILSRDQLDYFQYALMFVGLIDLELVWRPHFGRRLQVIGERSVGKTVLTHILGASAQHTCRHCWRPIIPWVNEKTGEIKESCACKANEPMVVVHVDVEDSFDPKWAARWGPNLALDPTEKKHKTYKSRDETFWVVVPRNANEAVDFIDGTLRDGASDFIIIDSIAMVVPLELLKNNKGEDVGVGNERVSPRARFMAQSITKLLNAQIVSKIKFDSQPTVLLTNQYYEGPVKNPHADPRKPVAGKRVGYALCQDLQLKARYTKGTSPGGIKGLIQYIDVDFTVLKSKAAGPGGGTGHYRLYLDDVQIGGKNSWRRAGDTDEPERLLAYLKQLGLFDKGKKACRCLGRDFKTIGEIKSFLERKDIQYLARFPILSALLPSTALDHLKEEFYAYSPFGKDPILDLATKREDAVPGEPEGDAGEEKTDTVESEDFVWPE